MAQIDDLLERLNGKRAPAGAFGSDAMAEDLASSPSISEPSLSAPAMRETASAPDSEKPDYLSQAILAFAPALAGVALGGSSGAKAAAAGSDMVNKSMDQMRQDRKNAQKLKSEADMKRLERDRQEKKETAKETQRLRERAEDKEDKRLDREANRDLRREQMENTQETRKLKQEELNLAQSKQLGLYEIGKKAEEQFQNATTGKGAFKPQKVGQVIDNSEWAPNWWKDPKAVEAQAAMSNWVEAFLRDASGAAIPPSERMAYAQDFFPVPGDSQEVIANKAEMRRQKMENALKSAGPRATPSTSKPSFPLQVRKGNQVATVSNDAELKEAQDEGWK